MLMDAPDIWGAPGCFMGMLKGMCLVVCGFAGAVQSSSVAAATMRGLIVRKLCQCYVKCLLSTKLLMCCHTCDVSVGYIWG